MIQEAVDDIQSMPELKHVDWAKYMAPSGAGEGAGGGRPSSGGQLPSLDGQAEGEEEDDVEEV